MKDDQFSDFIAQGLEIQSRASIAQATHAETDEEADEMRAVATCETALRDLVRAHGVSRILVALSGAADVAESALGEDFDMSHFSDFAAQLGAAVETIDE